MTVIEQQKNETDRDGSSRLAALEARLDSLVVAQRPWYKDPTLLAQITAVAAFLMSVVTTVVSAYRTYQQDLNAMKTELRSVIAQLLYHRIQGGELQIKYGSDPLLPVMFTHLAASDVQLARQAYSIVKELGDDASAFDYNQAALFLQGVHELTLAEELASKALIKSTNKKNFPDYLASARRLEMIKLEEGHIQESEFFMQMALKVFEIFPGAATNKCFVSYTHAETLLDAATLASYDCKKVIEYTSHASEHLEKCRHNDHALVRRRYQMINSCGQQPATPLLTRRLELALPQWNQLAPLLKPSYSIPQPGTR